MKVTIRSNKLKAFQDKIGSWGKKAVNLGLPAPEAIELRRWKETVRKEDRFYEIEWVDLEVIHSEIKIEGHRFLAALDHEGDACFIRALVPGDYYSWRNAAPLCEHCNTKRRRNTTFLLETPSGEIKQVASSCLAKYLGVDAAHAALASVYHVHRLSAWMEDEEWRDTALDVNYIPHLAFLAHVAMIVFAQGFVSRAKAAEGNEATADLAHAAWASGRYTPDTNCYEKARSVLAWVRDDMQGDTDYAHNCRVIATKEDININHIGTSASMIAAYDRAQEEKKAKVVSTGWFGRTNHFYVERATLLTKKVITSDFAVSDLLIWQLQSGAKIVWMTSSLCDTDFLEEGKTQWLRFQVKKQETYHGEPQTKVVRVSFPEEESVEKLRKKDAKTNAKRG